MSFVVYLDESGDHRLDKIDEQFPIFVLIAAVFDHKVYCERILPAVANLKFRYFGSEAPILHSYEIRKAAGDFRVLLNSETRKNFLDDVSKLMRDGDYHVLTFGIDKKRHLSRYAERAKNPYDLALEYLLERLIMMLESCDQIDLKIIAEERGKKEDSSLSSTFDRIIRTGTSYVSAQRFSRKRLELSFVPKKRNLVGHQIADLAGAPIAVHMLNQMSGTIQPKNQAFEIVEKKLNCPGVNRCMKLFPIEKQNDHTQ